MGKTIAALALCIASTFPARAEPPSLGKPARPRISAYKNTMDELCLLLKCPVPSDVRDLASRVDAKGGEALLAEFDVRTDRGAWFADRQPGEFRDGSLQSVLLKGFKYRFTAYDVTDSLKDGMKVYESGFEPFMFELDSWNLENHAYSFRFRYVYEYPGDGGYREVVSPWSDEVSIDCPRCID